MKLIFGFFLGVLFVASTSVYSVPKEKVCPTVLVLTLLKNGKEIASAEISSEQAYTTTNANGIGIQLFNTNKVYYPDRIQYNIKYK